MTNEQWAEVFKAGWEAITSKSEPAANALANALAAMERKTREFIPLEGRNDEGLL